MYVNKANSDVCHTAVILDAAHGNVQQPVHNLIAVYKPFPTLCHQNTDTTAHDITPTWNHAHLGTRSIPGPYCYHTRYSYKVVCVKTFDAIFRLFPTCYHRNKNIVPKPAIYPLKEMVWLDRLHPILSCRMGCGYMRPYHGGCSPPVTILYSGCLLWKKDDLSNTVVEG